jgi:hypothetical protein
MLDTASFEYEQTNAALGKSLIESRHPFACGSILLNQRGAAGGLNDPVSQLDLPDESRFHQLFKLVSHMQYNLLLKMS